MWRHLPPMLIYTRHPQCMHNVDNDAALRERIHNRHSPLTRVGKMQRDFTAEYIRREFPNIDVAFCSSYRRTRTIPRAAGLGHILREDARLDERNMGVWHQHPREVVLEQHPGEDLKIKSVGYYHYQAPRGETCERVEDKLLKFLNADWTKLKPKVAYISGHGISGLCLKRILLGGTVEDWHAYERLKNASVSVYERYGDGYKCVLYNHAPWEEHIDAELLKKISHEV